MARMHLSDGDGDALQETPPGSPEKEPPANESGDSEESEAEDDVRISRYFNRPDDHPSLEQLGYHFTKEGQLRDKNGDVFKFTNQKNYEQLGYAITEEIFVMLEEELGLQRIILRPEKEDGLEEYKYSFLFASEDYDEKETLLVLIHGMGAVRAGQWGRKLIVNESLEEGSQFPYIQRALDNDWGVIVMNTNFNEHYDYKDDQLVKLTYSRSSAVHARNVWKRCILNNDGTENIHVVAHSAGGGAISAVLDDSPEDRVRTIVLTDSWYTGPTGPLVVNFSASRGYGNAAYSSQGNRHFAMYSGTREHDRTSAACFEGAFFLMENWNKMPRKLLLCGAAKRVRGGCPWAEVEIAKIEKLFATQEEAANKQPVKASSGENLPRRRKRRVSSSPEPEPAEPDSSVSSLGLVALSGTASASESTLTPVNSLDALAAGCTEQPGDTVDGTEKKRVKL